MPRDRKAAVMKVAGPPGESPSVHLDALRGFAAFCVLLNHFRDALFVDYEALARHNPLTSAAYLVSGLGHQAVIVFFVLSGYLVGGSVLRSVRKGSWSWRDYLLDRFSRLYVVLLPALLLGGALDWLGMHRPGAEAVYSGNSGMHALAINVHSTLTWPILGANSLFLQTVTIHLPEFGPYAVPTFGSNGALWSLSYEFWYYLAFPVLVFLFARSQSWKMRAIACLGLLAWGWFVGSNIVLLGITWLMGALIAFLPAFPVRRSWTRGLAIAMALALFGAGLVYGKFEASSLSSDFVLGLAVTAMIWVTLDCATAPLPAFYVHAARRVAHTSFTLYLVHLPMLIFLKAALHLPRAYPGWHMVLVGAGVLAATVLYAQLVYEAFERNTDRVRRWIRPYVMGRRAA
jgi:peptidoglycan/LPS O-acetylase OafA/YrhL